ncbi:hypothetical protein QOZ80_1BG0052580 [Eleusine coracana subsp. coracana]|nr:hypothetical protein QOZ80_1BG0052580 [Eleusine coracana subsp. coracana]
MEKLDDQIYKKYTALKKKKLLDDELARKREADYKKLCDALKGWVKDLEEKNEELRQEMSDMLEEHKKMKENILDEIRARDKEIVRLHLLLTEKTDINNSTAAESLNRTPETPLKNLTPILASEEPQSNNKAKSMQLSEEAIVPSSSSPSEVPREFKCSRCPTCATGNGTNENFGAQMLHTLLESLVCMKISLNKETEGFSFSACHEDTGYSFTLTWLEQRNEWSYMVSSLGSLGSVADWMNQDIKFRMDMCPLFFQRISDIIKKS